MILEDNPYGDLRIEGEDIPCIKSLDEGVVIYAGTFSKVISPGMRVGYAIGAQSGPTKDGGLQAGRGRPHQHVGPDHLPPHYDQIRL